MEVKQTYYLFSFLDSSGSDTKSLFHFPKSIYILLGVQVVTMRKIKESLMQLDFKCLFHTGLNQDFAKAMSKLS